MPTKHIKNQDLFKELAYCNGKWLKAKSGKTIKVINPANEEVIGTVPCLQESEVLDAVKAAEKAFQTWKHTLVGERSKLLHNWYNLIVQNKDDLASILTLETGKNIKEALKEIDYGLGYIAWFAEEIKRVDGLIISSVLPNLKHEVWYEPVGVVAAITPWNFPMAMIARKLAPALAAGCTTVVKPAEQTPFSSTALVYLAEKAGFPAGVINLVTGIPSEIGQILTTHPAIKKVSFTGSTEVGKLLMKQSSSTLKKLSLELGGNAPLIIFDDVDLKELLPLVVEGKIRNYGQSCVCPNRIYVHSKIHDQFVKLVSEYFDNLQIGEPFNAKNDGGILINKEGLEKVTRLVNEAVKMGAKLHSGKQKLPAKGFYYAPTVISGVNANMTISQEEIFGPVLAIQKFDTVEEVIQKANDTHYGLAAYVFSQDVNKLEYVASRLEYGMVGCNTAIISYLNLPFGGVKQSGFGREGSHQGIYEFLTMKTVTRKTVIK